MEYTSGLPVVVETFPEFYETGYLMGATSLSGEVEIYFPSSSITRSRFKAFPLTRVRKYTRGILRPLTKPPRRLAKVRAMKALRVRRVRRVRAPARKPFATTVISPPAAGPTAASASVSAPIPTGGGYWAWFWAGRQLKSNS